MGFSGTGEKLYGVLFVVDRKTGLIEDAIAKSLPNGSAVDIVHSHNTRMMDPATFTGQEISPPTESIDISIADFLGAVHSRFSDVLPVEVLSHFGDARTYSRYTDGLEFSSTNVKESTAEAKKQRAVEVQRQAQALYEQGTSLSDYAKMDSMYDDDVASQLRGMYLRNGVDVGGRLADDKAEEIANDSQFWKRIVMPALQFPQRVFRKMGRAWDNKTDEGMMRNFHASEKYSNMFYSYKNQKLQEENIFKATAMARIHLNDPPKMVRRST